MPVVAAKASTIHWKSENSLQVSGHQNAIIDEPSENEKQQSDFLARLNGSYHILSRSELLMIRLVGDG